MSLPYPVSPDSREAGSPYLPNIPATGYPSNQGYPQGGQPGGYPPGPGGAYPNPGASTPGYPPTPNSGGYPNNPGAGYPPNAPGGIYPAIPDSGSGYPPHAGPSGGYPPNPSPISGGYPPHPSPGSGYPPNASSRDAYPPQSGPGYPSNPSMPSPSSGYTANPGGGYPANPSPGYPSNPSPGGGYPSNPSPGGGYPSNPSQGNNIFPSAPSAPPYHSSPSVAPQGSESPFQSSAYPGANNNSTPGGHFKIFKPFISSGLDHLPIPSQDGLLGKYKQSPSEPPSDMKYYKDQNYKELKSRLLKQGKLFEDPEFPATNSLLIDHCNGQDYVISYFGRSKCEKNSITWLRPGEITSRSGGKSPEMFVGVTNRFDINQGELGNCWFLAALSNLSEDKRYFAQVVPLDQSFKPSSSYAGIFRFRFWRFGQWVEIVVDDRLPTRGGKLIYLRSIDSNEFWGALLEKAYAKLYGSYKALEGGLTMEAAVDFTGGIPEFISLDTLSMSKERLFYLMSSADSNGAFMGASMTRRSGYAQEAKSKGLQSNHAYTITKVVEIRSRAISGGIPLVRVRNPHGNSKEWRGDWADGDKHWKAIPTHLRGKLGLTFEDDGEFYISFSDFCIYFGDLEICHLTPDAAVVNYDPQASNTKRYELFKFSGAWSNAKNTSGGCGNSGQMSFSKNPQYFIDLKDPNPYDDELQCPIVISLLQKKVNRAKECIPIGFKVYKCNPGTSSLNESFLKQNLSIERTESFMNIRETSKRMFLPEGRYCIIPCPFRQGDESEFLLRVFIQKSWGSSEQSHGKLVKDKTDSKKGHKFADDFDSRLGIHGYRDTVEDLKGGKFKKKIAGKALHILEQHFPEGTKGIKKLKQFYNWAKDKDSEFNLLKQIIKSC